MGEPTSTSAVRLRAIMDSGYLIERAVVRPGLVLYRARPSERAQAGAEPIEGRGGDEEEAIGQLYAAWAAGGRHS